MKTVITSLTFCLLFFNSIFAQSYQSVQLNSVITEVQPMTGIVIWHDNENSNYRKNLDAISLEYAYMKYNDIVKQKGVYDWTILENVLNDIASRNHQAIIRFYFVYPKDLPLRDGKTTVPDYIKSMSDYTDFKGKGDGVECYFPDWRNKELQSFTLDFYSKFTEKYDNDSRLAFVQTGFGLWSEYHTWSGEITVDGQKYKEAKMVGIGFPSKDYQETFLIHLNSVFVNTPWNISIDAADSDYSPMEIKSALKNLNYGLFDDSFMSEEHDSYNKFNWEFFGSERYKTTACGGEFNYYTDADQKGVLNPDGWRGKTYEQAAEQYHITYMIGNDQPDYRPMSRIKEASMASGYKFKVETFLTSEISSKVTVSNIGTAPIYYDAFVTVNGVKAAESLKNLYPKEKKEYIIQSGGSNPTLTIECNRLLSGQTIQFEANTSSTGISLLKENSIQLLISNKILSVVSDNKIVDIKVIDLTGKIAKSISNNNDLSIESLTQGTYVISISTDTHTVYRKVTL